MVPRRERVMRAVNFQATDRLPKDLGGMASTGISCFAYPKLVEALGLKPRPPRIHDTGQMLALPDVDVLDALDCDVVTVYWGVTNAFEEPRKWKPYDFGGRLIARVRHPENFTVRPDGAIEQMPGRSLMPPAAYVFDVEHAGQSPDFLNKGILPLMDLKQLRTDLKKRLPKVREIRQFRRLCEKVRNSTDRAVLYNGPGQAAISIMSHGGLAVFPVICLLHPDYAAEFHEIMTQQSIAALEMMLPEIAPFIDIIMLGADDWGTQNATIAAPVVFRDLFLPYYKRINETAHRLAPNTKTFLHTCGAVYDVIDYIIESDFDILNPVQWTAGGHSFREWKDKCRGRIALWGGGVDTQATLPLGSIEDVEREVTEVCACLGEDGGYVFNAIHNLLAEVDPRKIISMYRIAGRRRG